MIEFDYERSNNKYKGKERLILLDMAMEMCMQIINMGMNLLLK